MSISAFHRASERFSAIVLVSALAFATVSLSPAAQAAPNPARPVWAHEATGRQPDPAVTFGTLPNGLRYAVMHNETPKEGVAMRLVIGSGSLVERDDEQGLAHLLEHMAFRGSRNVPDGEVVHLLERQGLRFGPDTNAATSHEQTVYSFNFPKSDQQALETGLTLFREVADRLNLSAPELEIEKGVVLSEERARDVPAYRAARAEFDNLLAGTTAAKRWPIGLVPVIQQATPERLRRYYRANYRPDNAVVIVIGKVDTAAVVTEITARFKDWSSAETGDKSADTAPAPLQPAVEFVAAGAPERLSLTWVRPADRRPDTLALEREALMRQIGFAVFNNRMRDQALKAGSPLLGASMGEDGLLLGVAALTQLQLSATPDKWQQALEAVVTTQRRMQRDGVQPGELQRVITTLRASFQAAKAQESTRDSATLAEGLVRAVRDGSVPTSADQDLRLVEEVFAQATPERVRQAFASAFVGQGPIVFRAAQTQAIGVDRLSAQLAAVLSQPVSQAEAERTITWPYEPAGEMGVINQRQVDPALGATVVNFANGTRLVVKHTDNTKGKVEVAVALGSGSAGVPAPLQRALWALPFAGLGGTAQLSLGDIAQWSQGAGRQVSLNLQPQVGQFTLRASSRPEDLATQLQLFNAFVRAPGFRPEIAEKMAATATTLPGQWQANAGLTFLREVQRVLGAGDGRYGLPLVDDLKAATLDDLRTVLREPLAGAADVVIVGDVAVDAAIAAVQSTLAVGAERPRMPRAVAQTTPVVDRSQPFVVRHGGRADQAYFGQYWLLPISVQDLPRITTARVAAALLQARLVDSVREKLGITYSPSAAVQASLDLPGLANFGASLETPQANFTVFAELLRKEVLELGSRPVSADELERAKQPLIQARLKDPENNGYWVSLLMRSLRDPEQVPSLTGEVERLRTVTPERLQQFFATTCASAPFTVEAVGQ